MPTKQEEIVIELLGLPASARARLAAQLIASLDDAADESAEELWKKEAARRVAEIEQQKVVCTPAEEVMRDARKRLRK